MRTSAEAAAAEAQKILQAEAQGFRRKLMAERAVPTIVALRQRLDEICRQELDAFRQENGPFSKDQDEMLDAVMSRMTQRIAGSLARELKEFPEKVEQEQMTTALRRLFHLQTAESATCRHQTVVGERPRIPWPQCASYQETVWMKLRLWRIRSFYGNGVKHLQWISQPLSKCMSHRP